MEGTRRVRKFRKKCPWYFKGTHIDQKKRELKKVLLTIIPKLYQDD